MFARVAFAVALALAFAPLPSGCVGAAITRIDPRAASLRATCDAFAHEQRAVGFSVAIIDDGAVLLDEAFGFADREAARPARTSTLYRLGSVSKPVCATIAMRLVEQGALALDAPIGECVADLPETIRPLTLHQLLSHTAGVRHYAFGRADNGTTHRSTREALELFVNDPLLFEPGAKYSYSTHAYTLVVAAIESVTKRDYVHVLREHARRFAPSLDCEILTESKSERASLYDGSGNGEAVARPVREDNSWKYGGGGLEATAMDVARFGQAVLDAEFVSARSRDEMWRPAVLNDASATNYGLGWRLAQDGSAVLHSGSQQGCHAMLLVVPDERLVIVVLSNTSGSGAPELAEALREQLTSEPIASEPVGATER
ncbi:MAG: serine hydrolase domain-containing protein [Planctomycetota bacterium]